MREPTLMPRRGSLSGEDSLIPLINIVFLLLIFFMVAGQIAQPQDADIRESHVSILLILCVVLTVLQSLYLPLRLYMAVQVIFRRVT